jgi:hypothetical protein
MDPSESFESQLQSLPLRTPSERLDERVLGSQTLPISTIWSGRRVPLWAAVSISLLMLISGIFVGLSVKSVPSDVVGTAAGRGDHTQVNLLAGNLAHPSDAVGPRTWPAGNPFDFTQTTVEFITSSDRAVIQISEGNDL